MVKTIIATEVSQIVLIFKNTNPSLEGKLFTGQSFLGEFHFQEKTVTVLSPFFPQQV